MNIKLNVDCEQCTDRMVDALADEETCLTDEQAASVRMEEVDVIDGYHIFQCPLDNDHKVAISISS